MIELSAAHFERICEDEPVRGRIASHEETRRRALRRFWIGLALAIAAALVTAILLGRAGWAAGGFVVSLVVLVFGIAVATVPLTHAGEDLKHPVLEALAGEGGLEYLPDGFDPPVYPEARRPLFGSLSRQSFTDLFHGADAEGRRHALYEAKLQRRQGKSTTTVFSGQVYAFQRRPGGGGTMLIVPDRGLFNFFKPSGGYERVRIEGDPDFEKKFEVYATDPMEAKRLLFDTALRRLLLDLRQSGRLFAYVGPEDAMVAVTGRDMFEPGSMFRRRHAHERVRAMFDETTAALARLKELKARLG